MAITAEMVATLVDLWRAGQQAAIAEIEAMGLSPAAEFAAEDDLPPELARLLGPLRAGVGGINVRIEDGYVRAVMGYEAQRAILRELAKIPGAKDLAGRLVSGAMDAGMAGIYEQNAELFPEGWEYSAIMDAATCGPCRFRDGERYATWAEAMLVMPGGGPNPECLGDGRCRCRIVPAAPAVLPTRGPAGRQAGSGPGVARKPGGPLGRVEVLPGGGQHAVGQKGWLIGSGPEAQKILPKPYRRGQPDLVLVRLDSGRHIWVRESKLGSIFRPSTIKGVSGSKLVQMPNGQMVFSGLGGPGGVSGLKDVMQYVDDGERVRLLDRFIMDTERGHRVAGDGVAVVIRRTADNPDGILIMVDGGEFSRADRHLDDFLEVFDAATARLPDEALKGLRQVVITTKWDPSRYADANYQLARITFYNGTAHVNEAIFTHELGHIIDGTDIGSRYGAVRFSWGDQWEQARDLDLITSDAFIQQHGGKSAFMEAESYHHSIIFGDEAVTNYGRTNNQEDFAESYRLYILDRRLGFIGTAADPATPLARVKVRFRDLFPARAAIFKKAGL